MPPNSEIEKLERRWKENPKGTVFAPYAEVLRKHGDYPLAKDVLKHGLELHPDHIPGNIVLGRCCLDLGEEGPAEAAFTHVLDLDTENVIALKALADITERQGRLMEAVNWLTRLMTVDPSNDEAREQLARVDAARNAASEGISGAATVETTRPVAIPERAEPIEVIQPATPKSLEDEPATRVGVGEIGDDAEAAIDAALGGLDTTLPAIPSAGPAGPPAGSVADPGARTLLTPQPESMAELEPGELDLSALASAVESQSLEGFTPEEPFTTSPPSRPPQAPTPLTRPSSGATGVFNIGGEPAPEIELRVEGSSEFQSPDASSEMLDLSPGRKSEFQEPDPAEELRLSTGAGSEYQSPSGADDLLNSSSTPPARPDFLDPLPVPFESVVTSGFAAMSVMPTEEMPGAVRIPPPGEEQVPVLEGAAAEPPSQGLVEMLEAASTASPPAEGVSGEIPGDSPGTPRTSEIRFIFPEDAAEPEQPRIRRISEETGSTEPEVTEAPLAEPQPVVTETMAELYARQGHMAEALNVYRVLAEQQPNDGRLAQRIREIEVTQAGGRGRLSYVAMDTGGESVESFFRSLSDARPTGGPRDAPEQGAPAAPTRPTSDPLSLSAIFGEEPPATTVVSEPSGSGTPDSFSFDQFFGGAGGSPSNPGPRPSMPSDEDLDQFQNWLKSLKR